MVVDASDVFTDYMNNLINEWRYLSRIRATLIKMFSPFGKIISEDFLWHTRGPKRGEPRGFAFIQYSSKEVSCCLSFISVRSSI